MAQYYIIRDQDGYGDVAIVWNWKRRDWCWDLDGEYNADDGFAYADSRTAADRARSIIARDIEYKFGSERAKGVRVVDRQGMRTALDETV